MTTAAPATGEVVAAEQDGAVAPRGASGTVAVDFDGVLHTYEKGWADGTIYGDLTPGAAEALECLTRAVAVVVFTCRSPQEVAGWLAARTPYSYMVDHGDEGYPFWGRRDAILVTARKYAALAYVDDRAVLYTREGGWAWALADVAEIGRRALSLPPALAAELGAALQPDGRVHGGPLARLSAEQAAATLEEACHAARTEWARRVDEQVVASPSEHADAMAGAVLARLGLALPGR